MRLILMFILLTILGWALKRFWHEWRLFRARTRGMRNAESAALVVPMIRCTVCAIHCPQSEAVFAAGQWFCGAKHVEQYRESR